MASQARKGAMRVPVAPEQAGGWSTPVVYHSLNLSWAVCTRRGSLILRVDKLTQEDVEAFDAPKEWAKRLASR